MTYDMVKYERGQVWVIRNKSNAPTINGREQAKDRPWLILSVGKFNKSSGMVTAVPLSTRDKARTLSQVEISNERNQTNVIMCEQIRTFDYNSGAYIFDYMGQLSEEVMEKVDVAVTLHLGIHYSPLTLKKLYDSMEAIIKSIGYLQERDNTPKFTDEDVLDFAVKLQSLASTTANDEISATKTKEVEDDRVVDDTPLTTSVNITTKDNTKEEKAPRVKWTKEKCEEFINDDKSMPMKKVMEKWSISKKTRYYAMKHYVQTLLTKM